MSILPPPRRDFWLAWGEDQNKNKDSYGTSFRCKINIQETHRKVSIPLGELEHGRAPYHGGMEHQGKPGLRRSGSGPNLLRIRGQRRVRIGNTRRHDWQTRRLGVPHYETTFHGHAAARRSQCKAQACRTSTVVSFELVKPRRNRARPYNTGQPWSFASKRSVPAKFYSSGASSRREEAPLILTKHGYSDLCGGA